MINKHKTTKTSYISSCENPFKWRHFNHEIILTCVRWYCKYALSYRDLEEMMIERGVEVDHSTIYRWVYRYSHELDKRMKYYKRSPNTSWRVDETYIKIKGKQKYLYRAIDKYGTPIDFFLSHKRDTNSAKRFFNKTLNKLKYYERPSTINTDKNPAYDGAIMDLKRDKKYEIKYFTKKKNPYLDEEENSSLYDNTLHRKVKYLNNIIESDHFRMKKPLKIIHGFKSFSSANRTIKGVESMLVIKKRECLFMDYCSRDYFSKSYNYYTKLSNCSEEEINKIYQNMPKYKLTTRDKIVDEIKFINKLFDIDTYTKTNLKKKGFIKPVNDDLFPPSKNNTTLDRWYITKYKELNKGSLCQKLGDFNNIKEEQVNLIRKA